MKLYILIGLVLLVSCNDQINKNSNQTLGVISGTVDYSGKQKVLRLGFALFAEADYPPTTRPPAATLVLPESASGPLVFPVEYEIPGVPFGTYYLEVYGDVDLNDTEHGPNVLLDPFVHGAGPIVVGSASAEVTLGLSLEDPSTDLDIISDGEVTLDAEGTDAFDIGTTEAITPADVIVVPKPGKAALYGTVAWDGDGSGTLMIAGFGSDPPTGPPVLFESFANVEFPFFYELTDVKPDTYYIIVYLDKNMQDGMGNHAIDPVSDGFRQVSLAADQSHLEDFVLSLAR